MVVWSFLVLFCPVLSCILRRVRCYEIYIYPYTLLAAYFVRLETGKSLHTSAGDDGLLRSPSLEVGLVRDVSIGVRLASGYHPLNHCGAALRENLECCWLLVHKQRYSDIYYEYPLSFMIRSWCGVLLYCVFLVRLFVCLFVWKEGSRGGLDWIGLDWFVAMREKKEKKKEHAQINIWCLTLIQRKEISISNEREKTNMSTTLHAHTKWASWKKWRSREWKKDSSWYSLIVMDLIICRVLTIMARNTAYLDRTLGISLLSVYSWD